MSFGVSLKRERELRGISLAEIAKTTKISVRLLEAIEKDRFDILPEGVFRKSFIKSYAKYLGMNEEQILHEYDLEVQPSTTSQAAPEKPSVSFRDSSAGSRRTLLLTFGVLLVLLAVGFGFWYFTRAGHNGRGDAAGESNHSRAPAPAAQPHSETNFAGSINYGAGPNTTDNPTTCCNIRHGRARRQQANDPSTLKVLGELAKKPEPRSRRGT